MAPRRRYCRVGTVLRLNNGILSSSCVNHLRPSCGPHFYFPFFSISPQKEKYESRQYLRARFYENKLCPQGVSDRARDFLLLLGFFFSRHTGVFHLFTVVHENLSCTLSSPLQRCFLWLVEHVRMVWIDSLRHTVPKVKRMSSSVLSLNSIISSSAKLGHRVLIVLG